MINNKNDRWTEFHNIVTKPEQKRLDQIEARLDDPDRLAEEISNVLPNAVGKTSKRSEALVQAFTPVVEKSVHESVRKSTKTFANLLYPVIRPAIQKAIANTFKRMIQSFNTAIDHSFSIKGLPWRMESIITRKPFAEVVLLHSLVYSVDQVFLIRKDSGILLHQVQSALGAGTQDGDLVSAIKLKNQNLLMIRRVDMDHSHFHFHIQKGREKSLAYERLKKSERFLKSFMANMSHELRTPMNSIMGISKMFTEYYADNLTEKQHKGLQLIYQSGKRLLSIIDNLLDLSKIEAGKLDIVNEPVLLEELLREQEQMTLALIKDTSKDIGFRLKIARGMPHRIIADQDKLRRVLVNLLGNAVKFTSKGEIRLSSYMHGEHIYFSVKDTGIGIESEHLTDIFESFVQVNGSMTREQGGTGLGLSLSKNLVKLMGGNISVNSEKGKGSVFSFFIPLVAAEDEIIEVEKREGENE